MLVLLKTSEFAPPPPQPQASSAVKPLVAHVYNHTWTAGSTPLSAPAGSFKCLLGPLVQRPTLKMTMMGGHQPVNIYVATNDARYQQVTQGDLIQLAEQDGDGTVLYTGVVSDLIETLDATSQFGFKLYPLSVFLALTPFANAYTSNTDAAQMVRDAVAGCSYLKTTAQSCPNTGQVGQYTFDTQSTALTGLQTASTIAGVNAFYYVDELGIVWFGIASTAGAPQFTVKRSQDYDVKKFSAPIDNLYNYFVVIGGTPPLTQAQITADAKAVPIACVYDDGALVPGYPPAPPSAAKNSRYGLRARIPAFQAPNLLDQTTLNNMTGTLGTILNRPNNKIQLTLWNFPRIALPNGTGGVTMRYWEPSSNDGLDEAEAGSGGYSPIFLISDLQVSGGQQVVTLTDLVQDQTDIEYKIDQMLQSMAAQGATAVQVGQSGYITPGSFPGSVPGGPYKPTIPNFYSP